MKKNTLNDQLHLTDQRPSGFDYLRLALSLAIIVLHSFYICGGQAMGMDILEGPYAPFTNFLVPAFFSLSGFLVTGSLIRAQKLSTFITLRFIRIIPALCVEVAISALLVGPMVTILPLKEYFTHPELLRYFLNIIGEIQYYLPGVFTNNPLKRTNQQLWTIPYELLSYASLSLIASTALIKRPVYFGILTLLLNLWCYNYIPLMLVCSFLWGVFFYLSKEKIILSFPIFCLSAAAEIIILTWPYGYIGYLAALPIAYMTIYLGTFNPRRKFPITKGDYSYGLYLYSFPIQQTIYQFLPGGKMWFTNLILSLVITGLCAYLSWTFIESKILNRKTAIVLFVNNALEKITLKKNLTGRSMK